MLFMGPWNVLFCQTTEYSVIQLMVTAGSAYQFRRFRQPLTLHNPAANFLLAMASPFPMASSAEALINDLAARTTIEDGVGLGDLR